MKRKPATKVVKGCVPIFIIRSHHLLPADLWRRFPAQAKEGSEVVGKCDTSVIVRPRAHPMACTDATPPEMEDVVAHAMNPPQAQKDGQDRIDELARTGDNVGLFNVIDHALSCLAMRARRGDGVALHMFCSLMTKTVEGVSQIAAKFPETLRPIARNRTTWPLIKSLHPMNGDSDDLLLKLQLGADTPISSDSFSKWKPDFAATVAGDLIKWIVDHYDSPPVTKETATECWSMAKAALLRSYPKPETVVEFRSMVTSPTRRQSPGRMRENILTTIRSRFLALLPLPHQS